MDDSPEPRVLTWRLPWSPQSVLGASPALGYPCFSLPGLCPRVAECILGGGGGGLLHNCVYGEADLLRPQCPEILYFTYPLFF